MLLLKRRKRLRVAGHSMLPTLRDGDEVLVDVTAYRQQAPQVGDIVWANHPLRTDISLIKRVSAVTKNGRFFLSSDNQDPRYFQKDSRHFGTVPREAINGRVCCRFFD